MKSGLLCLALCALATPASAQMTWTDKGFFNFNVGAQVGSSDVTVTTPFELYGETGSVTSAIDGKGGGFVDFSAGYKVYKNLTLGVGLTWTDGSSGAAVNASVPDALFFDAHRSVTATAGEITHQETQIHVTGTWMIPVTDKIDLGLAFGPTFFRVSQEVPNGVTVAEPGPTVTEVSVGKVEETSVGFHLGMDVNYMVNKRYGVGGMARYTVGSMEIANADDKLKLGGFQIGGGLRVRF